MVTTSEFRSAAELAIRNITKHGDTDIFPFPFETHALFDKAAEAAACIEEYNNNFDEYLARFSPHNINSLTPVSYSGFRWATQIDPIWNAYLLSATLALAEGIEQVRIPAENKTVFSYRYAPNRDTGDLFSRDYGWSQFMERSINLSAEKSFVVVCDISEFYPRLAHHRLENALKQVAGDTPYPKRIMSFLSNFSGTRSFGLPIGGPAARILSELTINQIDRLLVTNDITFTRFADDYHIFAGSREDAYRALFFLSEKLFENQGLSLQKSKTRIMTSAEFQATNPLALQQNEGHPEEEGESAAAAHGKNQLLRFSLRFDPYSATADEDYARLKDQVRKFDIIGLLKEEIAKSRIHIALARKIVTAIRYLEGSTKDDAILSILDNCDVLYPIFSSILLVLEQAYDDLQSETKIAVTRKLRDLIRTQSHIMRVDLHLCYAIRVLSRDDTPENSALLQQLYEARSSPLIRRDIILALGRWGEWYWLSDRRNRFRELNGAERRAFIAASYTLKDEGSHWRDHIKVEFNPFETFILKWAGEKAANPKWRIPL